MRIGIWHNVKLFFYIDTTRQFTIVTISNDIRETFIEFTNGYQKKKKNEINSRIYSNTVYHPSIKALPSGQRSFSNRRSYSLMI